MFCCQKQSSQFCLLITVGLFTVLIPLVNSEVTEDTPNSCQQRTSVQREEEVCELVPYTETYKDTCWNLFKWFSCTKTRIVYREECRIVLVTHIEIAWVCCSGYIEHNDQCIPVCLDGCVHGECVNPDECQCQDGFRGDDCSSSCDIGYFGSGCGSVCECENGADCDPVSGECTCTSGYIGDKCDTECSEWTHGMGCVLECLCYRNNTQICDNEDGRCTCKSGYQGALCEIRCPANETGSGCGQKCPCQNSGVCLAEDKGCQCTAGYTGDVCADPCEEGEWGVDCVNKCHCFNNGSCDPFTGHCSCLPGFIGVNCERECEIGYWGEDCSGNCSHCSFGMPCDFRDGTCLCNEFQSGDTCSNLTCPEDTFGIDCSHECLCENNATCDMLTGQCTCLAVGFGGPTCADEIPATTTVSPVDDGEDTSSSLPWIVLSGVLLLAIVAVIVGVVVILCVRRRRKQKKRRPPPGYPPERNGFVNPIMTKKQEDKEDGIYVDQEYVKYSASDEKVSGIGEGTHEQPSTSYEQSQCEEYEPTEQGKKKKVSVDKLPQLPPRVPDTKKTAKPVVPPKPVKQPSQDHVYEDLDLLNSPDYQGTSTTPTVNQSQIPEEEGFPKRRVSDNGIYQTPYGYYSAPQPESIPAKTNGENAIYESPTYVEPATSSATVGVQLKPGPSIQTYERVTPQEPIGYVDYADLIDEKAPQTENTSLKMGENDF
ncbi:uncharacterized protein LOC142348331 isoform X2 [Convolutriloba macropyga]|uniref:uncharacterized protein LOC142348331 isoform X2 n=1 Tax=Convolutriloba macropyga TaxID=536237 RepID=UPI003F527903